MVGNSELALSVFSSHTIASLVRDCSRCTLPMLKYQVAPNPSWGLMLMACSASGIRAASGTLRGGVHDPRRNLALPRCYAQHPPCPVPAHSQLRKCPPYPTLTADPPLPL